MPAISVNQERQTRAAEARVAEAMALGHAWAAEKADEYRDRVPAAEWPDFWDDRDDGPLPRELDAAERERMRRIANRAARERWLELVADQRAAESTEEDEDEAAAAALESELRASLPEGVTAGRDGSRVYLSETERGMERTVASIEDAWRVVEEWSEGRRSG